MSETQSLTLDDLFTDHPSGFPDLGHRPRHYAVDPDPPDLWGAPTLVGLPVATVAPTATVEAAVSTASSPVPPAPRPSSGGAHRPARGGGSTKARRGGAHSRDGAGPDRRVVLAVGATAALAAACGSSSHVRHNLADALGLGDKSGAGTPGGGAAAAVDVPSEAVPTTPGAAVPAVGTGVVGGTGAGTFPDRDASFTGSRAKKPVAPSKPKASTKPAAKPTTTSPINTPPSVPTPLAADPVEHLASRFTFGATPEVRAAIRSAGVDGWIVGQLAPTATGYAGVPAIASQMPLIGMSGPQARATLKAQGNEYGWDAMDQLSRATVALQAWSPWQLYERMVDFWANHLSIANHSDGQEVARHVFDRDVIRAHALGKFSEMLLAASKSPSMLLYLNQAQSTKDSPNENYARELMELHTLGVNGGYVEADVRSVAYLLTGRTVRDDAYVFDPGRHFVGPIKALTFTSANPSADGEAAGDAFLGYLAHHPSTANMIARKLAVRFVSDTPPDALIARLAQVYLANDTAIIPVLKALFAAPEFWASRGQKTRRPGEHVVATLRARGTSAGADLNKGLGDVVYRMSRMNNSPLDWKPPNGYPDVAAAWVSSGSMVTMWGVHRDIAGAGLGKDGITYTPITSLWGGGTPATAGAAVDALSMRLVGQRLPAAQRGALLTFLGATDATPVTSADLGGQLDDLAALLFDSIYHALR